VFRQFVIALKDSVTRTGIIANGSILNAQQILIQAFLGNFSIIVYHSADTELKIAMMVRRQLYVDWYYRSSAITPNDHTISIFASCFMRTRLKNKIV
jgi:hypothetical protein